MNDISLRGHLVIKVAEDYFERNINKSIKEFNIHAMQDALNEHLKFDVNVHMIENIHGRGSCTLNYIGEDNVPKILDISMPTEKNK